MMRLLVCGAPSSLVEGSACCPRSPKRPPHPRPYAHLPNPACRIHPGPSYGFNMRVIKELAIAEPLVDSVNPDQVVATEALLRSFDITTMTKGDATFSAPFSITATKNDYVHALVGGPRGIDTRRWAPARNDWHTCVSAWPRTKSESRCRRRGWGLQSSQGEGTGKLGRYGV